VINAYSTNIFYKRIGNGQPGDIGIVLRDDLGNLISGATVTVSGAWSGPLPNETAYGAGTYGVCRIGSFIDPPSNHAITITASKTGYQSASRTVNAASGYLPACGP
jgi:hypothetical protein